MIVAEYYALRNTQSTLTDTAFLLNDQAREMHQAFLNNIEYTTALFSMILQTKLE